MEEPKPKNGKTVLIVVLVLLFLFILSLCALGVYAYSSNSNIPVVSDIVEKIDTIITGEANFDNMVAESIDNTMSNPTMLASNKGITADLILALEASSEGSDLALDADGVVQVDSVEKSIALESDIGFTIADVSLNTNMDLRVFTSGTSGEIFVKFSEIPEFLSMIAPGIEQIAGLWIYSETPMNEGGLLSSDDGALSIDEDTKKDLSLLVRTDEFKNSVTRLPDRVFGQTRATCIGLDFTKAQYTALMAKYSEIQGAESTGSGLESEFNVDAELCLGRISKEVLYIDASLVSDEASIAFTLDNIVYSTTSLGIERPEADLDAADLGLDAYTTLE